LVLLYILNGFFQPVLSITLDGLFNGLAGVLAGLQLIWRRVGEACLLV